ncbi:MAG: hypothetical protein WBD16_12190 [Pyrinomonadaceae bacterium]
MEHFFTLFAQNRISVGNLHFQPEVDRVARVKLNESEKTKPAIIAEGAE